MIHMNITDATTAELLFFQPCLLWIMKCVHFTQREPLPLFIGAMARANTERI